MSGQYGLSETEKKFIKEIVIKNITCYHGDLFKDNELNIHISDGEGEENIYLCIN